MYTDSYRSYQNSSKAHPDKGAIFVCIGHPTDRIQSVYINDISHDM